MVYYGTYTGEQIVFCYEDQPNEKHYIEMTKVADRPTFLVTCCCDEEWVYEFYLGNNSEYEMVKFCILENMFECETMEELLEVLSEEFEDEFGDMLVIDDEFCCDECCDMLN